MPIGDILTRPHPAFAVPGLNNQVIADFMLLADRERRAAERKGDKARVAELDRELEQLASALS